ncbi:hypothetical protein [Erwinia sp.]|uniref:hypothetical protein n=1 Tax=Erwinia citreus TaxID=558 RepID=UPI00289CF443|nr:hypothetical protein [Erwinia sp.]
MKDRYLTDITPPPHDQIVSDWLKKQSYGIDSISYKIALFHDGFLYRSIICSGMGEYIQTSNFLCSIDLVNALAPDATYRGYDAIYATQQDYKKAFPTRQQPL